MSPVAHLQRPPVQAGQRLTGAPTASRGQHHRAATVDQHAPAPAEPVAGQPVTFTITVTPAPAAPAVRDVVIDFGDDSEDESLGAVSGSRTVAHIYEDDGSYIVTVTAHDAAGHQSTASIGITVAEADAAQ